MRDRVNSRSRFSDENHVKSGKGSAVIGSFPEFRGHNTQLPVNIFPKHLASIEALGTCRFSVWCLMFVLYREKHHPNRTMVSQKISGSMENEKTFLVNFSALRSRAENNGARSVILRHRARACGVGLCPRCCDILPEEAARSSSIFCGTAAVIERMAAISRPAGSNKASGGTGASGGK